MIPRPWRIRPMPRPRTHLSHVLLVVSSCSNLLFFLTYIHHQLRAPQITPYHISTWQHTLQYVCHLLHVCHPSHDWLVLPSSSNLSVLTWSHHQLHGSFRQLNLHHNISFEIPGTCRSSFIRWLVCYAYLVCSFHILHSLLRQLDHMLLRLPSYFTGCFLFPSRSYPGSLHFTTRSTSEVGLTIHRHVCSTTSTQHFH